MTLFLGIDPGKTGALALYDTSEGSLVVVDVPLHEIAPLPGKKTKRTRVDHYGLARQIDFWCQEGAPVPTVILEQVGVRPTEGAAGAFDFGRTYGILLGVCAAHFLRIELVTPTGWKRKLNVHGDKDVSRARASTLFPKHTHLWARKKDDGRAEAALLALYGAQTFGA
jgi:hypothetical protein